MNGNSSEGSSSVDMVTSSQGIPNLLLARKAFSQTTVVERTANRQSQCVESSTGPDRSSLPGDDKNTTVRTMKRKAGVCLSR